MEAPTAAARPIRTLVVDDVDDIRFLYRRALDNDDRFEVAGEAADGERALELAETLQPDLVLLDMAMPGMDGVAALPHLRRRSPASRIVLVSGFDLDARVPLFEAGAVAYLAKVMSPRAMVAELLVLLKALEEVEAAVDLLTATSGAATSGAAEQPARRRPLLELPPPEWAQPGRLRSLQAASLELVRPAVGRNGTSFELRIQLSAEMIRLTAAEPYPVAGEPLDPSDLEHLRNVAERSGAQREPWGHAVWVEVRRPDEGAAAGPRGRV